MNLKKHIIFIGILVTTLLIFVYFFFRFDMIEKEYVKDLVPHTERVAYNIRNLETEGRLSEQNLLNYMKLSNKKYQHLALISLLDRDHRVISAIKNDAYIQNRKIFNDIIHNLKDESQTAGLPDEYLVRYYNQTKYYVFFKEMKDRSLVLLFPYRLRGKYLAKVLLELFLIIIIAVIVSSVFYIYLEKKREHEVELDPEKPVPPAGPMEQANVYEEKPLIPEAGLLKESSIETLHHQVFELFSYIRNSYATGPVSLFIMDSRSSKLSKLFELKEKVFIRSETDMDSINISNDMGDEFAESSMVVLNTGKKILVPVHYGTSFLAVIQIERAEPFAGPEMNDIKERSQRLGRPAHRYLLTSETRFDHETGLFNKTYLQLKNEELLKKFIQNGHHYSVVLMMPFDPFVSLAEKELNHILGLIVEMIPSSIKNRSILCRNNDQIGLLLEGTGQREAMSISNDLTQSLSGKEVHYSGKLSIELKPRFGLGSTDVKSESANPLTAAMKKIELFR